MILAGTNDLGTVNPSETLANLCAMHEVAAAHGRLVGVLAMPLHTLPDSEARWAAQRFPRSQFLPCDGR